MEGLECNWNCHHYIHTSHEMQYSFNYNNEFVKFPTELAQLRQLKFVLDRPHI